MEGVARTLNTGFEAMGSALQQFQTGRQQAFDTQQDRQQAMAINQLYGVKDPDQVDALMQNPSFQQAVQGLTPERQTGVFQAGDQRGTDLISLISQRQGHDDDQQLRALRPSIQRAHADAMTGEFDPHSVLELNIPDAGESLDSLYATYRNHRGEERAQNIDTRAWNQDRRSAASHANAQTRFGWETEDRSNLVAERARGQAATAYENDYVDFMRTQAADSGQTYEEMDAGYVSQGVQGGIFKSYEEGLASLDRVRNAQLQNTAVSPLTQQEYQQHFSALDSIESQNRYGGGALSFNPSEAAAEIIDEVGGEFKRAFDATPHKASQVANEISDILSNGVTVLDENNVEHEVMVLPNDIRLALQYVNPHMSVRGTNSVREAFRRLASEDKSIIEDSNEMRELTTERARIALQMNDRRNQGAGNSTPR